MSDPNLPEGVTHRDIDRIGEPLPLTEEPEDVIYGRDGDKISCVRGDFFDLQSWPCGFGNTEEEALEDLIRQENDDK